MSEPLVVGPELDERVCRVLNIPSFSVTVTTTAGEQAPPVDFGYPAVSRTLESAWGALSALLTVFEGVQIVHVTEARPPIGCQAFLVPQAGPLIRSARHDNVPLAICDLVLQAEEHFNRKDRALTLVRPRAVRPPLSRGKR